MAIYFDSDMMAIIPFAAFVEKARSRLYCGVGLDVITVLVCFVVYIVGVLCVTAFFLFAKR